MNRSRLVTAIAALGVAMSTAGPAAAAPEPGAFSARPSEKAPQDKRGTFFRLHVERGTDRRQSVVIDNLSKRTKHLLVNAVDGRTGTTSGSVYTNRDDAQHGAGTWLTLPVKSIDLPAGKSVRLPFSIDVPRSAKPGDHLAGIAIQDAHRSHSKSRLAITQVIRVVVGVQIIVDGPSEAALTLGEVSMQALPGTKVPSVVVGLENSGTRLCKPHLDVTLTAPTGKQQTVSRELDTVLPGNRIDFPLPWPNALAAGTYEVGVQAKQCGEPQAVQATATLGETLQGTPDEPEPKAPTVIVQQASIPWTVIIGLLFAVAIVSALTAAFVLRRRPRSS